MKNLKHTDLQPCVMCGQGLMHDRQMTFYQLDLAYMLCNLPAIQRQAGLEMMLGGHAKLANAMGPNADLALIVSRGQALVCLACSMHHPLAVIAEKIAETTEPSDNPNDVVLGPFPGME